LKSRLDEHAAVTDCGVFVWLCLRPLKGAPWSEAFSSRYPPDASLSPSPALRPSLIASRSVAYRHWKRCFQERASSPLNSRSPDGIRGSTAVAPGFHIRATICCESPELSRTQEILAVSTSRSRGGRVLPHCLRRSIAGTFWPSNSSTG